MIIMERDSVRNVIMKVMFNDPSLWQITFWKNRIFQISVSKSGSKDTSGFIHRRIEELYWFFRLLYGRSNAYSCKYMV